MKNILKAAAVCAIMAVAGQSAAAEQLQSVTRSGDHAQFKGPASFFTGDVKVEMLWADTAEIRGGGAFVTFQPGARTHWHTHPAGQMFVVIEGEGRTGDSNGNIWRVLPGDVMVCPKDVKHWHGAAPDRSMRHLVVTGVDANGKNVTWMEPVTDAQYLGTK